MARVFMSLLVLEGRPELSAAITWEHIERSSKHTVDRNYIAQESLVSRGRNSHLGDFIRGGYDYLLSWDADIGVLDFSFNPLDKMISRNLDIVGGLYPMKGKDEITSIPMDPKEPCVMDGRLIKMHRLSSGCMLIKRTVVLKMIKDYGDLEYWDFSVNDITYALYQPFIHAWPLDCGWAHRSGKKEYLSEDWAFCERAIQSGFELYADTSIKLVHIGKYGYMIRLPKARDKQNKSLH